MLMQELSEAEYFLKKFHSLHPGATSSSFAHGQTLSGISSYERLLQVIPESEQPITVLDLACGDGFLLQKLVERQQVRLRLVGVDLSPEELDAAQARLGSAAAVLYCARAQALPLSDASVDFVLCHLALMLMDGICEVVASVHRVLKPGGVFSAVIVGEFQRGDAYEAFVQLLKNYLSEVNARGPRLGDPLTFSEQGLRSLFSAGTGFVEPIWIEDFVIRLDAPRNKVWEMLSLMYDVVLLSDAAKARLEAEFISAMGMLERADGSVPCSMGLRQITCTRL
ncbi:class I SAM-dependent methyltransferase [Gloeobacter morelensis MG652769]|uniref:Class I SAM-dependent methyltransferase n=2 Tax=Gloeobacter TaxID=33071 RepID=A0ABY3PJY6_9CYAN|nr:class I SAM-dependent methyltransferase [Gloeobacter morelensis MG652769]